MNDKLIKGISIAAVTIMLIIGCFCFDGVFSVHQKPKPVASKHEVVDSGFVGSEQKITSQKHPSEAPPNPPEKPKRSSKKFDKFFSEIKFEGYNENSPNNEITDELLKPDEIVIEFDPNKTFIVLSHHEHKKLEYKIEEQFETSLTISLEGPVYALENWKHYTSEWKELPSQDKYYTVLDVGLFDSRNFPAVSRDEIRKAVFDSCSDKDKKTHNLKKCEFCGFMMDYIKDCNDQYSGNCNVSITTIRFRIKVKEKNQWRIIKTIECKIPLGC